MNILIIPSWYPSEVAPSAGIFFREQAEALGRNHPDLNMGISTWGPNDPDLLLEAGHFLQWPSKLLQFQNRQASRNELLPNCIEYFTPALTWSRKWRKGNIQNIIKSNQLNAKYFIDQFGKVDIIHAHVAHPGGYIARELAAEFQVPLVVTEHMSPFPFRAYTDNRDFGRWMSPVYRDAATNIAVSTALQEMMQNRGIESIVLPNLVDERFFVPSSTPYDSKEILAIGRLENQKGYEYLLRAFQGVMKSNPEHHLTIIGEGSQRQQLLGLAAEMGLDNHVRWRGECSREEIRDALQQASFLVLSSLHENLPLVLLEALACGKPIVATACNGPEDIVNETNGLLAKVADVEDLQEQMQAMINGRSEYDGDAIRSDFERSYSSKVVTAALLEVYQHAVDGHQGTKK